MTITVTTTSSGPYAAVAQTAFAVTFQSAGPDQIEVRLDGDVVDPGDYVFTRDADGTGAVTFLSAVTGEVMIYSEPSFQQTTEFQRFGSFFPDMVNSPLDKLAAQNLWLRDRANALFSSSMRNADDRAGYYLAWDASGNPVLSTGTGADAGLRTDLASVLGATFIAKGEAAIDAILPVTPQEHGAVGDGVADDGPAIQLALDASSYVFFPKAAGYKITTPVVKVLTEDTVIDFNGQVLIGANMIDLSGEPIDAGTHTLSVNASRGDTAITISNVADVQPGDIINLQSNATPSATYADNKQDTVLARGTSGVTAVLEEGLSFNWSTVESGLLVSILRPVNLKLLRPVIQLDQTEGAVIGKWGIRCVGLTNVEIASPEFIGALPFTPSTNIYRYGIQLYYCIGWRVTNAVAYAMSYPLGVYGGSRNGREIDTRSRYCRHGNADVGAWSRGYTLVGLDDSDSYSSPSVHPAFDCHAHNVNVQKAVTLAAWRTIGGSIQSGRIHSLDATASTPAFDAGAMDAGYEYLYDDADYIYKNVRFDNPLRTAADLYHGFGRSAYVSGVTAIGFDTGADFGNLILGSGNSFGPTGRPTPSADGLLSSATVHTSVVLDASPFTHLAFDTQTANFTVGETVTGGTSAATGEIVSVDDTGTAGTLVLTGVTGTFQNNEALTDGAGGAALANGTVTSAYHIDPRQQLVQQGNGRLSCKGTVYRNLGTAEPTVVSIRLHTNALAGVLQSNFVMGRIKLFGWVLHTNAGLFAPLPKEFTFCFGANAGPSALSFPTNPVNDPQLTGVANESLTMTLSNPTFAGVTQIGNNADHWVQFDLSLASGRTAPFYSLVYELELLDVDAA